MKTFAITLFRSKERKKHIETHLKDRNLDFELIEAVDGSLLSDKSISELCDMKQVNQYPWWLTRGAIGCALSHQKVCQLIAESGNTAFVVEDDIILPTYIQSLLDEIKQNIQPDEVILLYYTSLEKAKLSTVKAKKIAYGRLLYPMNIKHTMTTTAYVIGHRAAEKLSKGIIPVRVTADSWDYFYKNKYFTSLRVHYPSVINTKNFKSSIDYLNANSWKERITLIVNKHQIPPFFQLLQYIRARRLHKIIHQYELTDNISPVYQNLKL